MSDENQKETPAPEQKTLIAECDESGTCEVSKEIPGEQSLEPAEHHDLKVIDTAGASSLMQVIEKIAALPDIDLDRVERLFDMHERMLATTKEQQFNLAMSLAQSEIQSVTVNRKNDFTKSAYADLSAIHEVAKPCWTKHGFSVMSKERPAENEGFITVTTEVRHSAGHKEVLESDWPLDVAGKDGKSNKTPIQGKGSTLQYARRYNECGIFDIAIAQLDKDGNQPSRVAKEIKTITEDQVKELEELLAKSDTTAESLCEQAGIYLLSDLKPGHFQPAIDHIKECTGEDK